MRFPLAINCFGAGVFFGILAVHFDAGLVVRNPPVWCALIMLMFIVFAGLAAAGSRRA